MRFPARPRPAAPALVLALFAPLLEGGPGAAGFAPGAAGFALDAAGFALDAAGRAPASSQEASIASLRADGLDILEALRERRIDLGEARGRVERLRRALADLAEREGWTPDRRRLELPIARPDDRSAAPIEGCPLFLEEDLVRLCPVDPSRSELWSDQVVVCEYACAPETAPGGGR